MLRYHAADVDYADYFDELPFTLIIAVFLFFRCAFLFFAFFRHGAALITPCHDAALL